MFLCFVFVSIATRQSLDSSCNEHGPVLLSSLLGGLLAAACEFPLFGTRQFHGRSLRTRLAQTVPTTRTTHQIAIKIQPVVETFGPYSTLGMMNTPTPITAPTKTITRTIVRS